MNPLMRVELTGSLDVAPGPVGSGTQPGIRVDVGSVSLAAPVAWWAELICELLAAGEFAGDELAWILAVAREEREHSARLPELADGQGAA